MPLKPPGTFVPFLSAKADEQHQRLYQEDRYELARLTQGLEGNTRGWDGSTLRGAFAAKARAQNAVFLHELYWASFRFEASDVPVVMGVPTPRTTRARLLDEHLLLLRQAALAANGWALLVATPEGKVAVAMLGHDGGLPAGGTPIFALDVCEHAYWTDFGANKGAYIDGMLIHVDDDAIEARAQRVGLAADEALRDAETACHHQVIPLCDGDDYRRGQRRGALDCVEAVRRLRGTKDGPR